MSVDDFNELKSKKYRIPTASSQSNNVPPVSTSAPVVHSIPQSTISSAPSVAQSASSESSQLELDLTPSESKQIINTLEGIESILNKMYKLMVKFDERVTTKKVKKS